MAEKKHVFESEVEALPPLKMVLGDIPSPDPVRRKPAGRPENDLRKAVHRLISHLQGEDRRSGYW